MAYQKYSRSVRLQHGQIRTLSGYAISSRVRLASIACAVLSFSLPGLAAAQQLCLPEDAAFRQIKERFKELPRAHGVVSEGRGVMYLTESETGGWTLLIVDPYGRACVMAAGDGLEVIEPRHGKPS